MRRIPPEDHERVEDANYVLHDVIYDAARAPRLKWFIITSARFIPRRFWADVAGWLEWNEYAHVPIIDALERRDAAAARTAMETHALTASDLLIKHFDSLSLWSD
jgi:DNA-binding GntR family transcriptional regulator